MVYKKRKGSDSGQSKGQTKQARQMNKKNGSKVVGRKTRSKDSPEGNDVLPQCVLIDSVLIASANIVADIL